MDTIIILIIDIEATDSGSLEAVATRHAANPKSETMDRQAPPCRGQFLWYYRTFCDEFSVDYCPVASSVNVPVNNLEYLQS